MPDKQGFGLVLSRRVGESIVISDNIVVTVTRIENGKVRLGIEAPGKCRFIAATNRSIANDLPRRCLINVAAA